MGDTFERLSWICIRNGKLLQALTKGRNMFYIPGGKREGNETNEIALIREIKEELDVVLKKETMQLLGVFEAQAHAMPDGTNVKMFCYTAEYSGKLKPKSEIDRLEWHTYAERKNVPPVGQVIFDYLHKKKMLK